MAAGTSTCHATVTLPAVIESMTMSSAGIASPPPSVLARADDEDFVPPVQQQRLVRQRAVEPVPREAAYESDTDESIDIMHTSDESESESEHTSDDDGFIVYDQTH